jgi:hypothetical protein
MTPRVNELGPTHIAGEIRLLPRRPQQARRTGTNG